METMTKRVTKKERRQAQLERHYRALEALWAVLGHETQANGKKLSVALLKLEREAHKSAEDYCNGLIDSDKWDAIQESIEKKVCALFKVDKIVGFFVNGDPRGCALKIDEAVMRDGNIKGCESRYKSVGLMTDWGGYGLLAPEITGN